MLLVFYMKYKIIIATLTYKFINIGVTVNKSSNKEAHFEVDQAEFKDLSIFEFKQLNVATSNFSINNKIGQGGFGPVYKVMHGFAGIVILFYYFFRFSIDA